MVSLMRCSSRAGSSASSQRPLIRNAIENRRLQSYTGIGRLKPGVTASQAAADLAVVQAALERAYPDTDARLRAVVTPLRDGLVAGFSGSLWLLFAAVTTLLLIACTNVAALLIARTSRRQPEIALRASLGASSRNIAAQLLIETAALALAGGAIGMIVAFGLTALIRAWAPDLPRAAEIEVNGRVIGYTLTSVLIIALACGLLPAMRGMRGSLRALGGRSIVATRQRAQWLLVGLQVALAMTLLVGAGLLIRSAAALSQADTGFDADDVLAFRISGRWDEADDSARLRQRVNDTIETLDALPGVDAVATAWSLPGMPRQYRIEFGLDGAGGSSASPVIAEWRSISSTYFATMRIPMVTGETCRAASTPSNDPAVLVNERFVSRYSTGRSTLGRTLSWEGGTRTGRVVGVVADAREAGLDRDPPPTVYACDAAPSPFPWFLVRAAGGPAALAHAVQVSVAAADPLRSVYDLAPLPSRIDNAYAQARIRTTLVALFGAAALVLACLGVYGTVSYAVGLRRREIGLRLALGGLRRDVVGELASHGLAVVGIAAAIGLALAGISSRMLAGMLYGVSTTDVATFAGALLVVFLTGAIAVLVPTLRATSAPILSALRDD